MQIIAALARERAVEKMVARIGHKDIDADLRDLCQLVYMILCEYDEGKICDLWENGQMNFFLARIIVNQYRSTRSQYYAEIGRFRSRGMAMGVAGDITDERIKYLNEKAKEKARQ